VNILFHNKPSIYIYGSIILEDFKLGWSDIDILCLTEEKITEEQAYQLVNMRQQLLEEYRDNLYFRSFEGGFLTIDAFINAVDDTVVYWGTTGQRITSKYNLDPFSLIELIEKGYLLYGDDIRDSFVYPAQEDIKKAIINHYDTIRKYAVTTSRSFYSAGWLLDIARCIYTLRTGKVIAKTQAGEWVLANNLVTDVEIMQKVINIRKDPQKYKDNDEIMKWTETLGPYIQRFADVLEKEIISAK
jgi:hypothetical protein